MDSKSIREIYDGLEEIIGRDLTNLLRDGSLTSSLAMKIIKEDFTLDKMESSLQMLSYFIVANATPPNESLTSELDQENYRIQSKNLKFIETTFRETVHEAKLTISNLPILLDEVIEKQIENVFSFYKKVDFNDDMLNIKPVIQKAQVDKEDRTEVMKRYLKGFYGNRLNQKISNNFFKKKPITYLENFAEQYQTVFSDNSI